VKQGKKLEGEDHAIKKDIVVATFAALSALATAEDMTEEVAVRRQQGVIWGEKQGSVIAYAYAAAATTSAATEYTIKEIAGVKQDEATVGVQLGFAMGDTQHEYTGGGHAPLQVIKTKGGKNEFFEWGCLPARIIGVQSTLQPPAYKFFKTFQFHNTVTNIKTRPSSATTWCGTIPP